MQTRSSKPGLIAAGVTFALETLRRMFSAHTAAAPGSARAPSSAKVQLQVIGVFPEVHQAVLRSDRGLQYTVTRKTPGVRVDELREGQRLSCVVAADVPRILEARILD